MSQLQGVLTLQMAQVLGSERLRKADPQPIPASLWLQEGGSTLTKTDTSCHAHKGDLGFPLHFRKMNVAAYVVPTL